MVYKSRSNVLGDLGYQKQFQILLFRLNVFIIFLVFVGRAPLREAPCRGREDPPKVPRSRSRHRREGPQGPNRRPRQEEIPRTF